MYCRHCGTEIPEGTNTCPSCGKVVDEGQKWFILPNEVILSLVYIF